MKDKNGTDISIGDSVKIEWPGDKSDGYTGTVVRYYNGTHATIKIPGFGGHNGNINDGTSDKWNVGESHLIVTKPSKKTETTPKTKEGETTMLSTAKNILEDNKEFAIVEAERKIGLTAFEKFESTMIERFPGSESFLQSKLGSIVIANAARYLGSIYTGPKKEIVNETTTVLMRGAYAKIGDSVDLNGFIETIFESVKGVIPSKDETK